MKNNDFDTLKEVIAYYENNIKSSMRCINDTEIHTVEKWLLNDHLSVVIAEAIVDNSVVNARTVANVILALCDAYDKKPTNQHKTIDHNKNIEAALESLTETVNRLCDKLNITNEKIAHDANGTVIKKFE